MRSFGTLAFRTVLAALFLAATAGVLIATAGPASATGNGYPDLQLLKTPEEASVGAGSMFNWTLNVTNLGSATAFNVMLTDIVEAGLLIQSVSPTPACAFSGQVVNCTIPPLDPGKSFELHIKVLTSGSDCRRFQNVGTVSSNNEPSWSLLDNTDVAHLTVECPDLRVVKTPDDTVVNAGDPFNWTINITNIGAGTALNVNLTDIVQSGLVILSVSPTPQCSFLFQVVTCNLGSLASGDSIEVQVQVKGSPEFCQRFKNVATAAASNEPGNVLSNNSDDGFATVRCPDLRLLKTPDGLVITSGDHFNWTINITNIGNGTARNVTFNDTLPAGLAIVSVSPTPQCSFLGQAVTCNLGNLTPSASVQVHIRVRANGNACGPIVNTGTVRASNEPSTLLQNNSDNGSVTVLCPDLRIRKTPDGDFVFAGDEFNWTLFVDNHGDGTARNVTVTDNIPPSLTILGVTPMPQCGFVLQLVTCNLGDLAAGGNVTIIIHVRTQVEDCPSVINTGTVMGSNEPPGRLGDNSDTGSIECGPREQEEPFLELLKIPDGLVVNQGESFNWTIEVINSGNIPATSVVVNDTIPAGLAIVSVSPTPDCGFVLQLVTCNLGTIADGDSVLIHIRVTATGAVCGRIVNTGHVTSSEDPLGDQGNNRDEGTVDVLCEDETRWMFAHRPFQNVTGLGPYLEERGLYVNPFNTSEVNGTLNVSTPYPDAANASLRLYGEAGRIAPRVFRSASEAFDPTVIPKDSATWNPAIILHNDPDFTGDSTYFDWIRACGQNANLKKHLRVWYEPGHDYHGPRVDAAHYTPATRADVVQVESTYLLLNSSTYRPVPGCARDTELPFPTKGIHRSLGDGHEQPGLDTMTRTRVGNVSAGTTTNGTIELMQEHNVAYGDVIQFLDHMLVFKGMVTDLQGKQRAQFEVYYIGNTFPDALRRINVHERTYLSRYNSEHPDPVHGDPSTTRTWFAQLGTYNTMKGTATVIVGKELARGDVFYVDGVRYEVPAVATVAGQFSYITLRTPLPKSDPLGSWTSVTSPTRDNKVDGQWQAQDFSVVSSQWLVEVDYADPIPLDPPYNNEFYRMVDDTDVRLWEPTKNVSSFPYGAPAKPLTGMPPGTGMPPFPEGERYLTQMFPPLDWKAYFGVVPTNFADEGPGYEDNLPLRWVEFNPGVNHGAWLPGLTGPQGFRYGNITFYWVKEWTEARLTKNLLEIPNGSRFDADDRPSHPDQFTAFVFPDHTNVVSEYFANLTLAYPCSRMDIVPGGTSPADCTKRVKLLGGDYLVTTSLRLQDRLQRHAFAHDPRMGEDVLHRFDLYFNGINITALFNGARLPVADTTVRLYGEPNATAPRMYGNASDPFDPAVIPKDSATFSPAIIQGTDLDFTIECEGENMGLEVRPTNGPPRPRCPPEDPPIFDWIRACGHDAHLKKHLRLWYEPGHDYLGPRVNGTNPATRAHVIQVESTYILIDHSSYRPVLACPETSEFPFPTKGVHLDLNDGHQQPGVDTMTRTRIGNVSSGTSVSGKAEVEQDVNFWYYGQQHQFLDHLLVFKGLVKGGMDDVTRAQFDIYYLGNTHKDMQKQVEIRNKTYFSRANMNYSTPMHFHPDETRTWYAELLSYDYYAETATLTVGKELQAGDVYYVDGVRYEVPAVSTVDGKLQFLTLRTPLPKSDPAGSWTSVTDPTRDDLYDGQYQAEDGSVVSSQWLVEIDNKDPIPLNPPFNRLNYTMVDDIDVRLWEPTVNKTYFPWGPPAPSLSAVPPGTGMPKFPQGERYLTQKNPPQEWRDFFGAQPTGFLDVGDSYAASLPQRLATADGINHEAWVAGLMGPQSFYEANVTFYWTLEWFEGRYSTNLLQLPRNSDLDKREVNTLPDMFTEFVLPDRPNPASALIGTLAFGATPACSRLDLFNATCVRTVPLLGGDYAIVVSLVEERDEAAPPPPNGPTAGPGPSPGPTGMHPYDRNRDCILNDDEVLAVVADWGAGRASDDVLLAGVAAWGRSPGRYC